MDRIALSGRVRKGQSVGESMVEAWERAVDMAFEARDEARLWQLLEIAEMQMQMHAAQTVEVAR